MKSPDTDQPVNLPEIHVKDMKDDQTRMLYMGAMVVVTHEMVRNLHVTTGHYTYAERALPTPRIGWVTGFRFLPSGHVEGGNGYAHTFAPDAGPRTRVAMVTWWPTQNPVPVARFRRLTGSGWVPAWWGPYPNCMPPADREALKGFDYPRDEKGRFA